MRLLLPDVSYRLVHLPAGRVRYVLLLPLVYVSPRYGKWVKLPPGYESDGASGPAQDVCSVSWWVHDFMCETQRWGDGSPCSGWQRSMVLHDILLEEGRWFRAFTWSMATVANEIALGRW